MTIRRQASLMWAATAMMCVLSQSPAAAQKPGTGLLPGQSILANAPGTTGCPEDLQKFYACAVEKAKAFKPPRTPDGKPNFQGFWGRSNNLSTTGLEGRNSPIIDPPAKIPYQPWAAERQKEFLKKYLDPTTRCMPGGVPRFSQGPGEHRILQTPGYIVFMSERGHNSRIVPIDNRPHIGQKLRLWLGDSVAHWEGNTLVIDTTNLNGLSALDTNMDFASDALHVVERYTMIDADNLLIEATLDDPTVFTQPWKMAWGKTRDPRQAKGLELLEEACVEGNRKWLEGEIAAGQKILTTPPRKP
jgi:hypothetical protein